MKYLQKALELAQKGLGRTWPNPTVGCVIVKDENIIGQARTADGGRPHAEAQALRTANCEQSTVYVTLEPCAHEGQTPSCAKTLVKAGVAEVVIGCLDPDPRTAGKGVKILEAAGIKVTVGVLEKECLEMNKGFFKLVKTGRPYVMLKAAISADGKYLRGNNKPRWVTGEKAREEVQRLRSTYDAILTGTGTVLADNPNLNVRLPGLENNSPVKVVVGKSEIPKTANIFHGKEVWFYADVVGAIAELGKRGITRLMIESGPTISNALLKNNLVDEVIIFQSSQNLGDDGEAFFTNDLLNNFKKISEAKIGDDAKIILIHE